MSSEKTRRTFLRTTGVAAGAAILPGFASATSEAEESNVEVKVDSVVENGIKHAVSLARDPDTGDIDGAIISIPNPETVQTEQVDTPTEINPDMYGISEEVLSDVEPTIFDGQKQSVSTDTISKTDDQDTDIWGELRDTTNADTLRDGPSIQSKSILEDVIEEIGAGTKDSIDRIGIYFEDSPKGTDCDAAVNSKEHRQLGTSIDYEKVLGDFTAVALGAVLGAVTSAVVSGGTALPVGGIVGAVAGFAIEQLKDSTNITQAYRDRDACTFGVCAPSIRVLVSGVWMDRDTDMLTVNGAPDAPALHLENFSTIDAGYEEVQRVSS